MKTCDLCKKETNHLKDIYSYNKDAFYETKVREVCDECFFDMNRYIKANLPNIDELRIKLIQEYIEKRKGRIFNGVS